MFFNPICSERGTGIIQILAALLIVSAAIAGLFISSYYVQSKANAHYHYRVALLKGAQKLEEIKWKNMYNKREVDLSGISTADFVIDEHNNYKVTGSLRLKKKSYQDLAVASYVAYDEVILTINWENGPSKYMNKVVDIPEEIVLREDYFYRTDTLTGGAE